MNFGLSFDLLTWYNIDPHCGHSYLPPTREELTQKMDNKRQEITESQRTERQMEGEVHRLKEEKLQMQSRMQKRETLVSKKNDLTSQVETLEREVRVRARRQARCSEIM